MDSIYLFTVLGDTWFHSYSKNDNEAKYKLWENKNDSFTSKDYYSHICHFWLMQNERIFHERPITTELHVMWRDIGESVFVFLISSQLNRTDVTCLSHPLLDSQTSRSSLICWRFGLKWWHAQLCASGNMRSHADET